MSGQFGALPSGIQRFLDHLAQLAAGGRALAYPADVADEDQVQVLVAHVLDELGRLDVMICNAGFGIEGPIEAHTTTMMRRLMDVNYMGTFFAARAVLPIFRRAGHGHLIVVSSIAGRRGAPYVSGYAATKAAQIGLIEALRAELAGSAIHVSGVYRCPSTRSSRMSCEPPRARRRSRRAGRASLPRRLRRRSSAACAIRVRRSTRTRRPGCCRSSARWRHRSAIV